MQNLETLIKLAKENDENAMLTIIDKFKPLIDKYYKKSKYDEDVKSAMVLKLIELVKVDIRFDKLREVNEGVLVNYIVSAMYHEYIALSGKRNKKTKAEVTCDDDNLINMVDLSENTMETEVDDVVFFEMLRTILTKREYDCVYYIEHMKYTAEEMAQWQSKSKQACNQGKLLAFDKIRKYYVTNGV